MMQLIFESGLFGLTLTFGVYILTTRLNERTRCPVLHPVLMAILVIIGVLLVFDIPLQDYLDGANIITLMLTPTTALLAYSIYNQLPLLKKYFIPIVAGCLAGSAASMVSVYVLCQVMGLGETLTATMLPKSVTTPIAMELSSQLGGISSVTVSPKTSAVPPTLKSRYTLASSTGISSGISKPHKSPAAAGQSAKKISAVFFLFRRPKKAAVSQGGF